MPASSPGNLDKKDKAKIANGSRSGWLSPFAGFQPARLAIDNPDILSPMPTRRRSKLSLRADDTLFAVKQRKAVPHEFVLDAVAALSPRTRPMFGCLAVYVADKIVLILRDKRDGTADNGVWLATTHEHHESLRTEFPNMRSIQVLGKEVTGWQVLPADAPDFEEAALRACELVVAGDPRIGKVRGGRRAAKSRDRRAANRSGQGQ